MIARWYSANIEMLKRAFGTVTYDNKCFSWILIHVFPLPPMYNKEFTALLIETPGNNIENYTDYNFYADRGLRRPDISGFEHIFDENGYNNYADKGYSRLSLHLHSFNPNLDVISGDNLIDICQTVYHFFALKKGL